MAYDEALAARVRELMTQQQGLTEQKMFGGIGFMLNGNMCVGVHGEDLIVRLAEDDADDALTDPHARPMDITRRPMKAWLFVAPEGIADKRSLRAWVDRAAAFVVTLPPKSGTTKKKM